MKRNYGVAGRLKAALKASKFKNAKEFCEKYSIPYFTFAQHAQGRRVPKFETLELYSKAFEVSLVWLETGEGDPYNSQEPSKSKSVIKESKGARQKGTEEIVDTELLATILTKTNQLKSNQHWNDKKHAEVTARLYNEISSISSDKYMQLDLLKRFLKFYKASVSDE